MCTVSRCAAPDVPAVAEPAGALAERETVRHNCGSDAEQRPNGAKGGAARAKPCGAPEAAHVRAVPRGLRRVLGRRRREALPRDVH